MGQLCTENLSALSIVPIFGLVGYMCVWWPSAAKLCFCCNFYSCGKHVHTIWKNNLMDFKYFTVSLGFFSLKFNKIWTIKLYCYGIMDVSNKITYWGKGRIAGRGIKRRGALCTPVTQMNNIFIINRKTYLNLPLSFLFNPLRWC